MSLPFSPMWFVTIASIIGTIANLKHKRWCFVVWSISNLIWMTYDFFLGAYPQAALMFVYFVLAIWGFFEWGDEKLKPRKKN